MKGIGWIIALVALPVVLIALYFKQRAGVAEQAAQNAQAQAQAAAVAAAARGPAFPGSQPGAPGFGDYATQIAGRVGGSAVNSILESFGL